MNDSSDFNFNKIRSNIEAAQKRTNEELGDSITPVVPQSIPYNIPANVPEINGVPLNIPYNPRGVLESTKPIVNVRDDYQPDFLIPKSSGDKILTLDIETYKNVDLSPEYTDYKLSKLVSSVLKDQDKIEKAKVKKHQESATNPMLGRIILIGIATNQTPRSQDWGIITDKVYYKAFTSFDKSEKEMLEKFWNDFIYYVDNGYTVVTFNGKEFDLPYIIFRSLVLDVNFKGIIKPFNLLKKYQNFEHCDLMQLFPKALTGDRYLGLNEMAYLLGFDVSYEPEGNKIEGWYEKRDFTEIIKKNTFDLVLTMMIYEKVRKYL